MHLVLFHDYYNSYFCRLKIVPFEKMLWRVSKGNVFVRFCDLDEEMVDPKTGEELLKSVFIIFYQGKALTNSVKKICEGFHATVYNCPASKVTHTHLIVRTR